MRGLLTVGRREITGSRLAAQFWYLYVALQNAVQMWNNVEQPKRKLAHVVINPR